MTENGIRTIPFYLYLAWVLVLSSCATRPILVATSPVSGEVAPNTDIIIVQPLLKFERVYDEAILPASDYQGNAIEAKMLAYAKSVVETRKFVIVDPQIYHEVEVAGLFNQLCSMSPKLSMGVVDNGANILFKRLASSNERIAVLMQFFKVKVGPDGKISTFGITSAMSSSVLQASLISCSTGKVLWRSQVLTRQLPQPESQQFSEALELLYQSFPRRKEE